MDVYYSFRHEFKSIIKNLRLKKKVSGHDFLKKYLSVDADPIRYDAYLGIML